MRNGGGGGGGGFLGPRQIQFSRSQLPSVSYPPSVERPPLSHTRNAVADGLRLTTPETARRADAHGKSKGGCCDQRPEGYNPIPR